MAHLTATSQINAYSTIKSLLKANTTLATKFKDSDFYEYEPLQKGMSFNGFPYIVIRADSMSGTPESIDSAIYDRAITYQIIMVVEWDARSKVASYQNAVLSALDSGASTFLSNNYYYKGVSLVSSESEVIHEKRVVTTTFELELDASVQP